MLQMSHGKWWFSEIPKTIGNRKKYKSIIQVLKPSQVQNEYEKVVETVFLLSS